MKTYPQLIGYDPLVLQYFEEQYVSVAALPPLLPFFFFPPALRKAHPSSRTHLCGFDINLTYPQHGIIPTVVPPQSDFPGASSSTPPPPSTNSSSRTLGRTLGLRLGNGRMNNNRARENANAVLRRTLEHVERAQRVRAREEREHPYARRSAVIHGRRDAWLRERRAARRDLTHRANGTIDPFYLCDTFDEMIDYALNFSAPWGEFFFFFFSGIQIFFFFFCCGCILLLLFCSCSIFLPAPGSLEGGFGIIEFHLVFLFIFGGLCADFVDACSGEQPSWLRCTSHLLSIYLFIHSIDFPSDRFSFQVYVRIPHTLSTPVELGCLF